MNRAFRHGAFGASAYQAWVRFARKLGVAFFWAVVVGFILGGAVYFRVERRPVAGELHWHQMLRLWLDRLELITVDWRARELGRVSERPDQVVLVNIDDETIANARESTHPEWAMHPWPRAVLGAVAEEAVREGAVRVYIDESFSEVSAHQCTGTAAEVGTNDDEHFAQAIKRLGDKVVLGFDWQQTQQRPPDRPLLPLLTRVAEVDREREALEWAQRVLNQRTATYVIQQGTRSTIWAGVASEAHASALAAKLGLKGPLDIRPVGPDDDAAEITNTSLLLRLTARHVAGVEADEIQEVPALLPPVATLLSPQTRWGSLKLIADADGVVRAIPLWLRPQARNSDAMMISSVALMAQATVAAPWEVKNGWLSLGGGNSVPVGDRGHLTLWWNSEQTGRGDRGSMRRAISAWKLLVNWDDERMHRGLRHHDNDLSGRIVVLTELRGASRVETPVGPMSRGAVWAQAISNLMSGQGIRRVSPRTDFMVTLMFAAAGAILSLAWSSLARRPGWLAWLATLVAVGAVHAFLARQLYVSQQREVAVVAPILACSLTFLASLGYARTLEHNLRELVFRTLGTAVRADVFRRVEQDLALMQPERRHLTVLFSDIEGFTAVANTKTPQMLVETLREHLSEMTEVVLEGEGHVDKYLGDGLMAFWGAPLTVADDAVLACAAVLQMHARFDARREVWEKRCQQPLTLRVGLDAGQAIVGEMGTVHRVNYTVMGEPVAIAFRLEAQAKMYGVRTLVSERVALEARHAFLFRQVDTVKFSRVEGGVKVFELLGPVGEEKQWPWLPEFEAACADVEAERWADATAKFQALLAQRPHDAVMLRYLSDCQLRLSATRS